MYYIHFMALKQHSGYSLFFETSAEKDFGMWHVCKKVFNKKKSIIIVNLASFELWKNLPDHVTCFSSLSLFKIEFKTVADMPLISNSKTKCSSGHSETTKPIHFVHFRWHLIIDILFCKAPFTTGNLNCLYKWEFEQNQRKF